MNIDTHIADRFLNRETNIQEEDKWLFPSLRTADGRRTEVVAELKKEHFVVLKIFLPSTVPCSRACFLSCVKSKKKLPFIW